MEIEDFSAIITSLTLAKELYDADRFDIVRQGFHDVLCGYSYYENIMVVTSSIFSGFCTTYNEENETDIMTFEDDVISDYFIYAMEYGKQHKLPHDQNPYVSQAHDEVRRWLNCSSCVDWKLLAYTKTKKAAKKSKLLVCIFLSCGCNAQEGVAYGLIQLYSWFKYKSDEFKVADVKRSEVPTETTETKEATESNLDTAATEGSTNDYALITGEVIAA